jgi:hypothetical protein
MVSPLSAVQSVVVTWAPSADPLIVGYNVYYGGASGSYTNLVSVGNTTNAIVSGLIEGGTYYFVATDYYSSGLESDPSAESAYTVPLTTTNLPPTLDPLPDLTINENSGTQVVPLSGITSGATNEVQPLSVTAVSSNPSLIANPTVTYSSPNTTGTLTFTPAPNAFGTGIITVTVNDGQTFNNTVTQSFTVTVNWVNQPPTLNPLTNLTINENAGAQSVALSGISSGATNEVQTLSVSAVSSNPSLIANPNVTYSSPNTTGTLSFTPAANAYGTAIITVTVNDGQTVNNTVSQSFTVTANWVNQPPTLNPLTNLTINENSGVQSVALSGISSGATNEVQTLSVTAVSSNPSLIANPTVTYSSPNTTGTLTFTPAPNAYGTGIITVTVNDGQTANNTVSQSFSVTVNQFNQPPTLNPLTNLTINENSGVESVALSGITSGATNELQPLSVTALSSNPSLIANPSVIYNNPNTTGTLSFAPTANAYGTAIITVTVNDGQTMNSTVSQSFTVTVNQFNQPPTLNPLSDLSINENAGSQSVPLSGISTGATNEVQPLTITAVSSNPSLIANPSVAYNSPGSSGLLMFTPASNAYGSSTITVTVNDGQPINNTVSQSFAVTVSFVNQPPTLNPLSNLTLNQNAGTQTVNLSGITPGAPNENQALTVTAVSSNPTLIPNPAVAYTSPNATAALTFTPTAGAYGTAVITVTVNDGQTVNNTFSQSFTVTVLPPNQPPTLDPINNIVINENASAQTVNLTGITPGPTNEQQTVTITAVSTNPGLIPNPLVSYTNPNSTGTLTFTPVPAAFGTATILVTANDGQAVNSTVTSSFTVTVNWVNQPPTLDPLSDLSLYQNAGAQTIILSGISSGAANETQPLTLTATSSNPSVVPTPALNYTSPNSTGTLTFTPAANALGSSTITVTVGDGQAQNGTFTQSFVVNITKPPSGHNPKPINQPPTLDPLNSLALPQNPGPQTVQLTGISTGSTNEIQPLTLTAVSSNPALIPNPTINYVSPNATGTLTVTPGVDALGPVNILVTVDDGQLLNNTVSRSFTITFSAPPTMAPLVTVPPASQTIPSTAEAVFQVTATGEAPLSYQWRKDGVDLPGATSSTLALTGLHRSDSGQYAARVSNSAGSVLSPAATLRVMVPQLLGSPQAQPDGTVTLLSGDNDGGLLSASNTGTFQAWGSSDLLNWQPLSASLTLTNGSLLVQDFAATNSPLRFYRLTESP